MDVQERVRATVEPLLAPLGVELFDVEVVGSGRARALRLFVDRDGDLDLDVIAAVSQTVSPALDAADLFDGPYTLEVSSPGVERPLRTPAHFARVVGEKVSVKTHEPVEGERRHEGALTGVHDDGITLDVDGRPRRLAFDQMAKARTVFEWGPAPKPGGPARTKRKKTKV